MKKVFVGIFIGILLSLLFSIVNISPIINIKDDEEPILAKSKSVCDEILKDTELEPVKKFEGKPAPVNFTNYPLAKTFYTVITNSAASGPNYAGHFTVAHWGCGTSCFQYAIIDSITGDIIEYNDQGSIYVSYPPSYDINSRLMVINERESLYDFEGLNIEEIIDRTRDLAGAERSFLVIEEYSDGDVWLNNICTENVLDGLYTEK